MPTKIHLLLHSQSIVKQGFTLFGVSWVMPSGVVELLATWPGSRHRNGVIWNIISHCLMRGIWRERNSQIFEGTKRLIHDFKLSFFQTLLGWMNISGVFNFTSLSNFLDSCTFYAS